MSANLAYARVLAALDDKSPALDLWITGVIREGVNEVTPVTDCDQLHVGDRLIGSYVSSGCRVRLHVRANPCSSSRPMTSLTSDEVPRPPNGSWELHTADMRPGDYTLTLHVVEPTDRGRTPCCSLDFRLAKPRAAAPSPRIASAWKLTSGHDPAACQ